MIYTQGAAAQMNDTVKHREHSHSRTLTVEKQLTTTTQHIFVVLRPSISSYIQRSYRFFLPKKRYMDKYILLYILKISVAFNYCVFF